VKEESIISDHAIPRLKLQDITMSGIQPAQTKQRSATTLIATLPGASVTPSIRSEEEDVQPNQRRIEIQELGETAKPSQSDNPTFDPTTVAKSVNKLAL